MASRSPGQNGRSSRSYRKDCSYLVNVRDNKAMKPNKLIKVVEANCGVGALYACVPKGGDCYEITMDGKASAQILLNGIRIDNQLCDVNEVVRTFIVVSFLHIPAYIEDDELIEKLESLKVTVLSPVQRRYYPGTDIADGTRFVKVRLPPTLPSIPYSVKLDSSYFSCSP